MADVIRKESTDPPTLRRESVGPPIIIYAGSVGSADQVVLVPPIPGYGSTVQLALTGLANAINTNVASGLASNIALGTAVPGLPGVSDVRSALAELAKDISVQASFTQAALSVAGIFPYVHSRDTTVPSVEVWNERGERVYADDIIVVSPNEIGVLLKSFEPIPGSWRVKVSRG
jgi:hypothetical protein